MKLQALNAPSATDEEKLALLDGLAADPSESATATVLATIGHPSTVVAGAALRALRGRPCGQIASPLMTMLRNDEWERRAWAAKVLGESGCRETIDTLKDALNRESDGRVQSLLDTAIAALATKLEEPRP